MLKREGPEAPAVEAAASPEESEPQPERVVTARHPDHVWHVDLTVIPTILGGFWSMLWPGTLPQMFPFCYWMAVAEDHLSRRAMGFRLFKRRPTSAQVRAFLPRAFRDAGVVPTHLICDKGKQFDCHGFRSWCRRRGVKWRYGAAGKHGSIAVIERLIRTIRDECNRRITVPLRIASTRAELSSWLHWYNGYRPHMTLRGRTPDEVYRDLEPANEQPRYEPRRRYPLDAWCASPQTKVKGRRGVKLRLDVSYSEGRRHLPVVGIRPAA